MLARKMLFAASTVIAATAIFSAPPAHSAEQTWDHIDFMKGVCVHGPQGPEIFTTPNTLHNMLRKADIIDDMQVSRDENGKPSVVIIGYKWEGQDASMIFFTDPQKCLAALDVLTQEGHIVPKDVN